MTNKSSRYWATMKTGHWVKLIVSSEWVLVWRSSNSEQIQNAHSCYVAVRYFCTRLGKDISEFAWLGEGQCKLEYHWSITIKPSVGEWCQWQQALTKALSLNQWHHLAYLLGKLLEGPDPWGLHFEPNSSCLWKVTSGAWMFFSLYPRCSHTLAFVDTLAYTMQHPYWQSYNGPQSLRVVLIGNWLVLDLLCDIWCNTSWIWTNCVRWNGSRTGTQFGKYSTFHAPYLCYKKPTSSYVELPIQPPSTMATLDPNAEGFKPVTKPKPVKKARMTPNGVPLVKLEFEMAIQIIFQLPNSHHNTFSPAQQMQHFVQELMKYDPSLAFSALEENGNILYPQYDTFPTTEKDFEQYFYMHPVPKKSIHQNMVMIGCRLLSANKIADLKKATTDTSNLMEWLKNCHIFIEADLLGYRTICTLGYFFFMHLNITHRTSLKGVIQEALNDVKLMYEKLKNSTNWRTLTMPTMKCWRIYQMTTMKTMRTPFEVYSTPVGYGSGTMHVATRAMCIKSTVKHGKLLHELLLRMKINPNVFPSLKYILVGMVTTIGSVPYMNLIQQNNVYLSSVAMIAVAGIQDQTLNLGNTCELCIGTLEDANPLKNLDDNRMVHTNWTNSNAGSNSSYHYKKQLGPRAAMARWQPSTTIYQLSSEKNQVHPRPWLPGCSPNWSPSCK